MMEQKKGRCSPMHWGCGLVPLLTGAAWLIALISAVCGWWQARQGIDPTVSYWNALVFGVVALYGHRSRMGSCQKQCCGSGKSGSC